MNLAQNVIESRVRQVVDDIKPYQPLRVILFGSAARGDADEFSDLDFTERQAQEAVQLATTIFDLAHQAITKGGRT